MMTKNVHKETNICMLGVSDRGASFIHYILEC